jgi:hypothetical protein
MIRTRYLIYAAIAIVLGLIAIYPALDNARRIMEGMSL